MGSYYVKYISYVSVYPLKYTPCLVSKPVSGVSEFFYVGLLKRMHSVYRIIV